MRGTRCTVLLAVWSLVLVAAPAPAAIFSSTPFTIRWTAPGDDSLAGRASVYDLRYSTVPINAANYSLATRITGLPLPAVAGVQESFVVSGLTDGTLVYMAIKTADERGNWSGVSNILTRAGQTAGVDPSALTLSFSSAWPNPARQSAHWDYAMPQAAHLQVDVFDVTGRHVHTIASGERAAGRGELSWDLYDDRGRPVGAGLYFVKTHVGTMEWTKRLIVVR
jgi:hypothetical protein